MLPFIFKEVDEIVTNKWELEVKRIANIFLSDFYHGERESKRICEENDWNEKEFSQEVMWYFEDLLNM